MSACLLMSVSASFLSANQVNICTAEDGTRCLVEALRGMLLIGSVFAPLKNESGLAKVHFLLIVRDLVIWSKVLFH